MIDDNHSILIYLLRCILHEKKTDSQIMESTYPSIEWDEVMKLARAHNLLPLIFTAAEEIPSFQQHPIYHDLLQDVMVMVAQQMRRTQALLDLYQQMEEKGTPKPLVMKGLVCRLLYGEYADYRPSGDEDLLIKKEEYPNVAQFLQSQGFIPERSVVTTKQLEDVQEIGFFHLQSGLYIELHVNAIGHENTWRKQINDSFYNVFDHVRTFTVQDVEIPAMDHTSEFIYLVYHALKHLAGSGFGIRQAIDILMYRQQYFDQINWNDVQSAMISFKGKKFYQDLLLIGKTHFGFEYSEKIKPCCPDELLDELFSSGAFGNATQEQRTASQYTCSAMAAQGKFKKPRMIFRLIFPKKAQLIDVNPELLEKPWMLPVCWMKRWQRFLRHNREQGGHLAQAGIALGKRRVRLLKRYGLV